MTGPSIQSTPRRIALIPARGGSKRLPKKNILPLHGRPLVSWTIHSALTSELFERVVVSTDDDEIAEIAMNDGATVLFRPVVLGSDQATVAEVCRYHLLEYAENEENFTHLYCLYPTAPLRSSADLCCISNIFTEHHDAKAVVAVTQFSHYPHQALYQGPDGCLAPYWPELSELRASSLPSFWAGNGSTYAILTDEFLRINGFFPESGVYPYKMNTIKSIDVDTIDDFKLLELVSKADHSH